MNKEIINVTKTYLPDKEKYKKYVDEIYENGWVTNNGPLVQRLEKKLAEYLGVKNIVLVSNGTIALEIAYRVLNLKGSVITTPFSFVATTSSLVTNGLNPIFVDIDENTFNLDPYKIQPSIKSDTTAIVPVHVFGNPCDIEKIQDIANKNKLKVIYDAAHAFGVTYKGKSVLNYGDISTLSFHATKLFHTIEGGALIINDDNLVEKARYLINFGIKNEEEIPKLGTNAKMNEFEAAMGLCVLDDMEKIKEKRKEIFNCYAKELKENVYIQRWNQYATQNYSYFPILFTSESKMQETQKKLKEHNIFSRRYFYPSLDTLSYLELAQNKCRVSRNISKNILCLPTFYDLKKDSQEFIITLIKEVL